MDHIAADIGISSSAVWKILLHRSVKPLLDGGRFDALDLFQAPATGPGAGKETPSPGARADGGRR